MSVEVLDPGPLTTVQDRGRVGWAHLGVPRAGALDRGAAALANRLVGNPEDRAVLETTYGGLTLRAGRALTAAVTGATAVVRVDGRAVAHGLAISLRQGAVLSVGPAQRGLRSYVAVAGGIDVEPVLGSRSTDTLAWVGPPRLAPGMLLPTGRVTGAPGAVDVAPAPRHDGLITWWRAQRSDWIDADQWASLEQATFVVGGASDRIGLRLEGFPLLRREGEVPSEGVVTGAVQVPPSGEPVVFLADHPTTGGYPVVAVVDDADLDFCAQLRPGDHVRVRVR